MNTTRHSKGMSTFELLLAFSILSLSLTAVISMVYGNQSAMVDTQTTTEALNRAQKFIEQERALAASDFLAASTTSTTESIGSQTYTEAMLVADITPCKKIATSTVSWNNGTLRPQKIELATILTDIPGTRALGGDCPTSAPVNGWTNPTRFASDTFSPGKPLALDVLDRIVYVAEDKTPFLMIANTKNATLHQTNGLFVTYTNGFDAGNQINSIDAIQWTNPATGAKKVYVFAAMNTTSNQLKVIDVTVPTAPNVVSVVSLSSCVTGSFPQGWQVLAYGNRLYLTVRETAGPELHVFDISTPSTPTELSIGSGSCKGLELTDTAEQMAVHDQTVGGISKRYLYLATDESDREIRVLDVTNSLSISEATHVDLAGGQDGASVYLLGTKLYFGRKSVASGAELYLYDASNPVTGLLLLGSKDIGTDVLGIRVAGPLAFLATGKTNQEFQVWNIANPAAITNVAVYNFGNVVGAGIDYEPDFIYATGQSTPNFQMLYSP